MQPTPRQQLADLALGRSVADYIVERYAAPGTTFRSIAAELREITKGQVNVSDVTVRAWYLASLKNAA